jgi:D-sedoheptulose 7-phosphate isomerase
MTDFLYPFLDGGRPDVPALLADLAGSATAKAADSTALAVATLEREIEHIDALAGEMVERFGAGGRLFTFGNGGSSTDAASLAGLFREPPWGRTLSARCLVDDPAVLTALGNDVGFDLVFSRQLIARATWPSACRRAGTRGT